MNYICAELPSGKWRIYEEQGGERKLVDTFDDEDKVVDYLVAQSGKCMHEDFVDFPDDSGRCNDCGLYVARIEEAE